MIFSKLKVLMAERDLKVNKVASDTGISLTTLIGLFDNTLKGVRLDTINKLCQYFNVSINEFFDYLPVDFEVIDNSYNYLGKVSEVPLIVVEKTYSRTLGKDEKKFSLVGRYMESDNISDSEASIQSIEVLLGDRNDSEVYESQIEDFNSFLDSLKGNFKELFFKQVREKIENRLNLKSDNSSYEFKFTFNSAYVDTFLDPLLDDPFKTPLDLPFKTPPTGVGIKDEDKGFGDNDKSNNDIDDPFARG